MSKLRTPRQKVATLLIALGEDIASEILKTLPAKEVKTLIQAMSEMKNISQDNLHTVINDFLTAITQPQNGLQPDAQFARRVLEKSQKPGESIDHLLPDIPTFECLDPLSGQEIANILVNEHPQTIALVLSQLSADKLATTFKYIHTSLHTEVLLRIAKLNQVDTQVLFELEETLESLIQKSSQTTRTQVGGIQKVSQLLQNTNPELAKTLLENLKDTQPDLADAIEEQLLQFEDLLKFDKNSMMVLVQIIPPQDWMIALRGLPQVLDYLCQFMSSRSASTFKEDFAVQSAQKQSDVQAMRQNILKKIRELEKEGKIRLPNEQETWV